VGHCAFARLLKVCLVCALSLPGQQQPDVDIDSIVRKAIVETVISRIEAAYVIPEAAVRTVQMLRHAVTTGAYDEFVSARKFAEKLTLDLQSVSGDRHLAVFFDPETTAKPAAANAVSRERFNFGFSKLERLSGNVGYLDLRSFANLDEGRATASDYLDGLANFDAIIIDLRQNGGGHTPMVAYIASYFFSSQPVHLTDMYWRDEDRTIEIWTSDNVPGRRSVTQDLYLLVGPSTFSAAEDFCFSLKQLGRATLVGETTGGGAHMGRGIERLSPLFTAFIPTGQSLSPRSKSNWENVGVQPDVKVPVQQALYEAHLLALHRLVERESDPVWRDEIQKALQNLTKSK